MPALCAAIGSFHVKSPTTYLVTVLMTIRVLSFFLTVVLIFSVTLFVSILGVRSYSDHRYWSMQISATRHSSGVSAGRTTGSGYSFTSFNMDRDTSCTRVSGGGVGRESGKGASRTGTPAAEKPARTEAVSGGSGSAVAASDMAAGATLGSGRLRWDVAAAAMEPIALANGASTAPPASALKGVAPRVALRSPIALLSMPDEPKTPGPAKPQPVRAIVPHNITNGTSCRGVISPSPRST